MRIFSRVLVTAALLVPAGVLIAQPPAFAAGGTSCKTQTGVANITPGLGTTAKPQTIASTTTISGCVGGGVTGGTSKSTVHLPASSCANLTGVSTSKLTETITWNTKKTSTVSATETANKPAVQEATIAGTVTAGLFVGQKVSTVVKFTISKGSCTDAHPLTQLKITGLKPFVA